MHKMKKFIFSVSKMEDIVNIDNNDEVNIEITPVVDQSASQIVSSDSLLSHISNITRSWTTYQNGCDDNRAVRVSHRNRFKYDIKHLFYKKHQAYAFSDKHGRLPVFSIDISDTDAKKAYVVTGYQKWWIDYKNVTSDKRYAYEVVLSDLPCHLYVDMEAEYCTNPELKGCIDRIFKQLMLELVEFMKYMHLAPKKCLDNVNIIILDSSKSSKFSKH